MIFTSQRRRSNSQLLINIPEEQLQINSKTTAPTGYSSITKATGTHLALRRTFSLEESQHW